MCYVLLFNLDIYFILLFFFMMAKGTGLYFLLCEKSNSYNSKSLHYGVSPVLNLCMTEIVS